MIDERHHTKQDQQPHKRSIHNLRVFQLQTRQQTMTLYIQADQRTAQSNHRRRVHNDDIHAVRRAESRAGPVPRESWVESDADAAGPEPCAEGALDCRRDEPDYEGAEDRGVVLVWWGQGEHVDEC